MKIEDHEKINELMGKITNIGNELLEIQKEIHKMEDGCEVASKEYFDLFDVYVEVVNTQMARGVVFEKLANMVTKED